MYRRNPSHKPPEEDYVAALILRGLPMLAQAWQPLLQQWGIRLSLTGVFCHQTPKARFRRMRKMESPELADLLIVRRHGDSRGMARQVAVLIQAKMSDTGEIKLPNNDPQLFLYTTWPSFELLGQKASTTSFCLGQDKQQALYAGIADGRPPNIEPPNRAWAGFCPWAIMPPKQSGWVEEPLSLYLVKLLNFEAGREFFDSGTTGCHWSELVHYLLEATFSLPLRTRDMRLDDPRGMTIGFNRMAFMLADSRLPSAYVPPIRVRQIVGGGEGPPPDEREVQFAEGGEGRVVIIETSEVKG
jgi:hypothetical protein